MFALGAFVTWLVTYLYYKSSKKVTKEDMDDIRRQLKALRELVLEVARIVEDASLKRQFKVLEELIHEFGKPIDPKKAKKIWVKLIKKTREEISNITG